MLFVHKGGDPDAFTKITRAYEALRTRHEMEEEEDDECTLIEVSLSLAKSGLGIELEQIGSAPNTQLKVTGIVPGKSAEADGSVHKGDFMAQINETNIRGVSLDEVFKMLLGMIQQAQAVGADEKDKIVHLVFVRKQEIPAPQDSGEDDDDGGQSKGQTEGEGAE